MMFVKKYFHKIIKEKEDWLKKLKVALMDVEEYITRMKSDGTNERLLIAFFFYFLATIITWRSKVGSHIQIFIPRVVDDLALWNGDVSCLMTT